MTNNSEYEQERQIAAHSMMKVVGELRNRFPDDFFAGHIDIDVINPDMVMTLSDGQSHTGPVAICNIRSIRRPDEDPNDLDDYGDEEE